MNIAITAFAILFFMLILIMVGCTTNQPFRTNYEPTGGDYTKAASSNPLLPITSSTLRVEFDDQGWFWNIHQRSDVEQMIRDEAGIGSVHVATPQGIILRRISVHGWKDNAASDGDGVKAFGEILQQLHDAELAQTDHPARKVVGVYVGWRGLSATWEPFKEFSFLGPEIHRTQSGWLRGHDQIAPCGSGEYPERQS